MRRRHFLNATASVLAAGFISGCRSGPDYLDCVLSSSRGIRYLGGAKLFFPEEYPDVVAEEARRLWQA